MTLHVRYDGQSVDITFQQAGVNTSMSDREVQEALARHFDTPLNKFYDYVVDRPESGDLVVRPQAVYG